MAVFADHLGHPGSFPSAANCVIPTDSGASAQRSRHAAHWASWADCLAMVHERHPAVAEAMVVGLEREPAPCLAAVRHCRQVLAEASFHQPSGTDLTVVFPERAEKEEPNQRKVGWQQRASRSLETKFLNEYVWPGMTNAEKALLRSQRGPLAWSEGFPPGSGAGVQRGPRHHKRVCA